MIETQRLLLRPHRVEDFETMLAMSSDVEVMRYIGHGKPADRSDVWGKLMRNIGHWASFGYGLFAVVDKTSGVHIGDAGLAHYQRDLGADFDPFPEAGWVFASAAHGRGYATEAAAAAHDWFDDKFGVGRRVCIIDPDNAGSLGVARRLGYEVYGEATFKGDKVVKLEQVG